MFVGIAAPGCRSDFARMPPQNPSPRSENPMTVMQCSACFFPYDEAKGLPDEGIPPGTKWEDIPDDWVCPDCGTPKHLFIEYTP